MTTAEAIGSTRSSRAPAPARTRATRPLVQTTASPSAVSVAARPRLNATISSEPEHDLRLGDRAEQDDERGRARDQAGRRAHAPAGPRVLSVVVVVVVMVVVVVVVRAWSPRTRDAQHAEARR